MEVEVVGFFAGFGGSGFFVTVTPIVLEIPPPSVVATVIVQEPGLIALIVPLEAVAIEVLLEVHDKVLLAASFGRTDVLMPIDFPSSRLTEVLSTVSSATFLCEVSCSLRISCVILLFS